MIGRFQGSMGSFWNYHNVRVDRLSSISMVIYILYTFILLHFFGRMSPLSLFCKCPMSPTRRGTENQPSTDTETLKDQLFSEYNVPYSIFTHEEKLLWPRCFSSIPWDGQGGASSFLCMMSGDVSMQGMIHELALRSESVLQLHYCLTWLKTLHTGARAERPSEESRANSNITTNKVFIWPI